MTVVDVKLFTFKGMLFIYTRAFVSLYDKKNNGQVYEIYEIVELQKMSISTTKNSYNFDAHQIIEILSVLYIGYMFFKDKDKFKFYINSFVNDNYFNYLYNFDKIKRGIKNVDIITCKLRLAFIRVTNFKIKVFKEER